MTGRASAGPSRGSDAPTRTTWTRDGVVTILAVLGLALAARLIIAYAYPGTGLSFDLDSFHAWSSSLARDGLYGVYDRDFFLDYTPGYLYVLWLVGLVGQATGGIGDLIKIPPILADVAIGWLVWSMALELGASRRAALFGAALFVVNPVTWFDSVTWGQVDSFGVVFLLLGLRELWRDRPERSAVWAVIAALIKPQLAILVPIVAVVTIRRALWPTDPDAVAAAGLREDAGLVDRIRAWERRTGRPIRILTTGLAGLITTIVLCLPVGLSVIEIGPTGLRSGLLEQIFSTAAGYPYVAVNAYNPWALAQLGTNGLAANGTWVCDTVIANPVSGGAACPTAFMFFGVIPAVAVGAALLAFAFAVVSGIVAFRPDRLTLLVGLTVLAVAFFMLPTRVHERYLYPFFALGAILAAVSWRWRAAYVAFVITTFLNMYVVLTTLYANIGNGNPGIVDWLGIGGATRSQEGVTAIAVLNLLTALWVFAQLRDGAFDALRAELAGRHLVPDAWGPRGSAAGTDGDPGLVPDAVPAAAAPGAVSADARIFGREGPHVAAATAARSSGPVASPAPDAEPATPAVPAWTEPASAAEVGVLEWLRQKITARPIRPDRSKALDVEPGGRLDKLDLWILVVLVAAVLGVRMFRLAEPYQMHFDEVYHARTATEFLQDWRYGYSHDIYEWTHPHLAKYAMAGGLVAWGDDRVSATSDLGVPVSDAIIEPRRDEPQVTGSRGGDRVHVATGDELRSYDLQDRRLVYGASVPGASSLAYDPVSYRLYVGTTGGDILLFDATTLDGVSGPDEASLGAQPSAFGRVDGGIDQMYASDDGRTLFVATSDGRLITLDTDSAEPIGDVAIEGIAAFAPGGTGPVIAVQDSVEDPAAAAKVLADLLGGEAATYEARLSQSESGTIVAGVGGPDQKANIDAAIADGRLAGLSVQDAPRTAIATKRGVTFVAASTGDVVSSVELDGGAFGLALVTGIDDAKLYVSTGGTTEDAPGEVATIAVGGNVAKNGPIRQTTMPLPGRGSTVMYDEASQMVHVLGVQPDGEGSTIYVIEPHGNAVFADSPLPFDPVEVLMDSAQLYPTDDRQQILAFESGGEVASVEVGKHEFAWRVPGVLAGAAMAAFLYVLGRILFRRREVAVLVGLFALVDGMLFVQSRIGMNDAYVGVFIVAAYTLFATVWTGYWRWRGAFWVAMPIIGAFLGLALASKWVALYAMGGVGLLILVRSALGRLLAILGLVVITGVLGHLALVVPEGGGLGNLPFVAIMIALTCAAVVINVLHPIAWSDDEMRFAVAAPAAIGVLVALVAVATKTIERSIVIGGFALTPIHVAGALVLLSLAVYGGFFVAANAGFGPLARPPAATDPAALLPPSSPPPRDSWLRPGALLGLPVVWMLACLLALPVAIYVASYIPWAFMQGHQLFAGWPPGHEGQTLVALTQQMYDYHNNLTAGHAASSPWWAWPLDLKPVWFYQEGLAGGTTAAIYDAGNLVIWWLGIPAIAFVAWQAYVRRSLALTLILIAFLCQWVAWARIDRAAFQYHYYTSLPFVILALAYFAAELWNGASRRTWLFAKAAAAVAILGPAILWLLARPLCGFVGVDRAVPNSAACPPIIPNLVVTAQTAAVGLVVFVAILAFIYWVATLDPTTDDMSRSLVRLLGIAVGAVFGIVVALVVVPPVAVVDIAGFPAEPLVLLAATALALLAVFVLTARDARRFVVGMVSAAVGWFLVVYPNFAALPLPTVIANAYQGILPTYPYPFQFPSNRAEVVKDVKLLDPVALILAGAVVLLCLVLAYSAWTWRIALAERAARDADAAAGGLMPGSPGG
ncbi:MAG: phospholipid carrier-dependent glycosyltransferase [Chloroflexota bacterium]